MLERPEKSHAPGITADHDNVTFTVSGEYALKGLLTPIENRASSAI